MVMSYEIHYGNDRPRRARTGVIIAAAVAAVFLTARLMFPNGLSSALERVMPATGQTVRAVEAFVEDMQHGSGFAEAAAAFCRGIIENAELEAA